ncbi:MAG TPA: hypothetical protein VHU18_03555 [Rhizomicrobium sp.]|nr:hypothetical protein [Rhizomicrobium sp.]
MTLAIDKGSGHPPTEFQNVPWYPGLTVLQSMIVAQAMYPNAFNFRVNFHSQYGAFVESIDDVAEGGGKYWLLSIGDVSESYGASEAIIIENPIGSVSVVHWTFQVPGHAITSKKTAARIAADAQADGA